MLEVYWSGAKLGPTWAFTTRFVPMFYNSPIKAAVHSLALARTESGRNL